jgi:hypothetical protein
MFSDMASSYSSIEVLEVLNAKPQPRWIRLTRRIFIKIFLLRMR